MYLMRGGGAIHTWIFRQYTIQTRGVIRASELEGGREHKLANAARAHNHRSTTAVGLQHRNVCSMPACMQN